MSKEIYVVNCYTCQHNGQETCKGCNTLLNGDVEPYENWELREDLSQKDQRIAELEQELAELKGKVIVPKFKIGQEVWHVYNKYQKYPFRCVIDKIVYDSSKNHKFRYDTSGELYVGIKEEDLFATEQEAQEKLKEIQGNE